MPPVVNMTIVPNAQEETARIGLEIDQFAKEIAAISDVLPGLVMALQDCTDRAHSRLQDFEKEKCEVQVDGPKRTVNIPIQDLRSWKRLWRTYEHFNHSRLLVPRSLLVSLVSQYDAFLGRLIRAIMIGKPEILNGSAKQLSFADLSRFSSIEAAREYILEKEIESILRSSHSEQFEWMEKSFGVSLRKDLKIWPVFVELTERRNLLVHMDGVVSSQYLAVCKAHQCHLDETTREGVRLGVPQEYFVAAHASVFEIGAKLGQVLWRKMFPLQIEEADSHLIRQTYDLIEIGKYGLAIPLLECACRYFKVASEANGLMMTVNLAQAYKWSGNDGRCAEILRGVDWSAKGDEFKLANAVLAEEWKNAAGLVRQMGSKGPVRKTDYRDWPLFRAFRKQEAFLSAYEDVFGEAFPQKSQVSKVETAAGAEEVVAKPTVPPAQC